MLNVKALLLIFVIAASVTAQEVSTAVSHKGIDLFKQGKFAAAIIELEAASKSKEWKNNPEIWNVLGVAYINTDEFKKANKVLSRAVKLDPKNSTYFTNLGYALVLNRQPQKARGTLDKAIGLDPRNVNAHFVRGKAVLWIGMPEKAEADGRRSIELDPTFAAGYKLVSDAIMQGLNTETAQDGEIWADHVVIKKAVDALELGVQRTTGKGRQELADELAGIRAFYDFFSRRNAGPARTATATPNPGTEPFKILAKPSAKYTDAARRAGIQGPVRVAVLLTADGKLGRSLVLKRLDDGLDRAALAAASQIKFEPKKVNGQPVAAVALLEYIFNLY